MALFERLCGRDWDYTNAQIRLEINRLDAAAQSEFWTVYMEHVAPIPDEATKQSVIVGLIDGYHALHSWQAALSHVCSRPIRVFGYDAAPAAPVVAARPRAPAKHHETRYLNDLILGVGDAVRPECHTGVAVPQAAAVVGAKPAPTSFSTSTFVSAHGDSQFNSPCSSSSSSSSATGSSAPTAPAVAAVPPPKPSQLRVVIPHARPPAGTLPRSTLGSAAGSATCHAPPSTPAAAAAAYKSPCPSPTKSVCSVSTAHTATSFLSSNASTATAASAHPSIASATASEAIAVPPPAAQGFRAAVPRANTACATTASPTATSKGVNGYVFIKTLGQGTFGKVKLAEHKSTGALVAIKIIEKASVKTLKQRNSVQREVRLMKLLHHPHIVGVRDIVEHAQRIYIIMEYAAGGELFKYIVNSGLVKEREARHFFRQILSAMDYCHRNSIIHRDLKPENLLLDEHKNIKIIDFGFANTFHRERTLDTYCGSPFYAAPEMIRGVRYVGPEADVWSLGVILFVLLSGRLPFSAGTVGELYDCISKGVYETPAHVSRDAAQLIARMLTVNSKNRATLDEVLAHRWTNHGYVTLPNAINTCFASPLRDASRPQVPHPASLAELVSFGIAEADIRRLLAHPAGQHPITSLYHLVEEARVRRASCQLPNASDAVALPPTPVSPEGAALGHGVAPKPILFHRQASSSTTMYDATLSNDQAFA